MPTSPAHPEPVTLDNCAREPIHVPGAIQPHGVLLALDRLGRISHLSANAAELLNPSVALGRPLTAGDLGGDADLLAFVTQALRDGHEHDDIAPVSHEAVLGGQPVDVVVHTHHGYTLCEFERRSVAADRLTSFAEKAYRLMDNLKRQRTVDKLMDAAVQAVRGATGFDRVMAYRFRHDDSGEVVAEARRDDLEAYLGRRYPATDIPAQARRLYTINTLRLIADVDYTPVPLLAEASRVEPLDLSHSVLRSVSPIHLEYLRNMGVRASMSISIVVGGRLWGMIACHHQAPLQVPYSIRMACDVMAQMLASSVQSLAAQAREAAVARAAWVRSEVATRVAQGNDALGVLGEHAALLQDNLHSDAILIALEGHRRVHGADDGLWADALLAWLKAQPDPLVQATKCSDLPGLEGGGALPFCGLLGLRFDATRGGWIVALRREQIETIRWGGKPEKAVAPGPLGPRLTPRGSFEEWRETVRGTAEPWSDTELEIASQLLDAVSRAYTERVLEQDRLRSQLWAVLGHDLRNPLQSLSVASRLLDHPGQGTSVNRIIRNSTDRMQRLLHDVLDISRVQNGLGLDLRTSPIDLVKLVHDLVEESQVAHPDTAIATSLPASLVAEVDPGRYAQVVSNLLSNARHHGHGKVQMDLWQDATDGAAVLSISNPSPPIPDELLPSLFDPFKRAPGSNTRNRTGMGLGLYIAAQIVKGHGGQLAYRAAEGLVIFEARVPASRHA